MNQIISVHPHIKKIIQTIDFDLGSELNKFEQSLNQDSVLIPDILPDNSPKQDLSSSLVYHLQAPESEEPISVASRLLDTPSNEHKTSLLDVILTPWGILGIVIFFGTNLFIFVNQYSKIAIDNYNDHQENIVENNLPISENNLNTEELNPLNTPENNSPPLPIRLPEVNNSIENKSPNPNLKTALLNEINPSANQTLLPSSPNSNNLPPATVNSANPPVTSPSPKTVKYYLVTNYENMENFNRIKTVIPNALILNFGRDIKIQLGVFATETEAKKQSRQLQNQGIISQIITQ
ncbi:hypothetical protein ACN4EE_18490 [Geminocystis sp. CENA526]|uniref:hypothetical protein n=1 Tax=Geminocystis sp. CENA526 TaxID=1355871 RepID=UPI003D6EC5E6